MCVALPLWRHQVGLRQAKGEDKSNDDPFIKWHEGVLQLLGALDLAPDDPAIWRDAGKAVVTLGSLSEDPPQQARIALSLFSQACKMEPSMLPEVRAWLEDGAFSYCCSHHSSHTAAQALPSRSWGRAQQPCDQRTMRTNRRVAKAPAQISRSGAWMWAHIHIHIQI